MKKIVALFVLFTFACASTDFNDQLYVRGGFSALPNIGLTLGGGQIFSQAKGETTKALELVGTWQPLDEEFFANDGNPAAGDWSQVSLGILHYDPAEIYRWNIRYGVVWCRAQGQPNMVQLPGDYNGAYASFGFDTELSQGLRMGPELQLNAIGMEGGRDPQAIHLVPQLVWRAIWQF